jgi:hypothetical protein
MTTNWFKQLMGFEERSYEETQRNIEIVGQTLRSRVNDRSYVVGTLETASLGELRDRATGSLAQLSGKLKVSQIAGDVAAMHRDPANGNALFQVASQFNLLEMTDPDITPEDGVTRYVHDRTQGPACALAAAAATIFRNYCVPVHGQAGQTRHRQLDCLGDIGTALQNRQNGLWTMQNGYALCTGEGLATIDRTLGRLTPYELDSLRDLLRVGLHWGVQVTGIDRTDLVVSQALCSALPISYTSVPSERWKLFAELVLEGAYEATLWAAVVNAQRSSSHVVFLTLLGGGAFGNERKWILDAIRRALRKVITVGLDVRLVSHRDSDPELERLIHDFA